MADNKKTKNVEHEEKRTISDLTTYDLAYLKSVCKQNKGKPEVDSFYDFINCVLADDNVGPLSDIQVKLLEFYAKNCPQIVSNAIEISRHVKETETEFIYKHGKISKSNKPNKTTIEYILDLHDEYMDTLAQMDMDALNDDCQGLNELNTALETQVKAYENTADSHDKEYPENFKKIQEYHAAEKEKLMMQIKEADSGIEELHKRIKSCREELDEEKAELDEYKTIIKSLGYTVKKGKLVKIVEEPKIAEQKPEGDAPYEVGDDEPEHCIAYELEETPSSVYLKEKLQRIADPEHVVEKHTAEFYQKIEEAKNLANICATKNSYSETEINANNFKGTTDEEIKEMAENVQKAKHYTNVLSNELTMYMSPKTKNPSTPEHAKELVSMIDFLREKYPGVQRDYELGGEVISEVVIYGRAKAYLGPKKKIKKIK